MNNKQYLEKSYKHAIAYGYVGEFSTFSKSKYLDYVRASTALLRDFVSYDEWLSLSVWSSRQ